MSSEAISVTAASISKASAADGQIFDNPFRLSAVREQIAEQLETTKHVLEQVREAKRLRRLKEPLLDPAERSWIDRAIADAEAAARAVAALLEPSRVEYETRDGKIGLQMRMAWVLRHRRRAADKRLLLLTCQNSVLTAISHLQTRSPAPVIEASRNTMSGCEKEVAVVQSEGYGQSTYEMNELFAWRSSKQATLSDDSLSQPTMRNSEICEMP